jgi:hypothetical protein
MEWKKYTKNAVGWADGRLSQQKSIFNHHFHICHSFKEFPAKDRQPIFAGK